MIIRRTAFRFNDMYAIAYFSRTHIIAVLADDVEIPLLYIILA